MNERSVADNLLKDIQFRFPTLVRNLPGPSIAEALEEEFYERTLFRLQCELVKLQDWVLHQKLKIAVLFEGRDAAGKGGVIRRITQRLNPRERVMGFCSESEYHDFLTTVPSFERMITASGIVLIKYWFSISYEEQLRRLSERARHPLKRWKLSPIDIEALKR